MKEITEKRFREKLSADGLFNPEIDRALDILHRHNKEGNMGTEVFPVTCEVIRFFKGSTTTDIIITALLFRLFEGSLSREELHREFPVTFNFLLSRMLPLVRGRAPETYNERIRQDLNYMNQLYSAPFESKIIKILDLINNPGTKGPLDQKEFALLELKRFYLPFAKDTNNELYLKLLKVYEKQRINPLGSENLEYEVKKAEVKVKDNYESSSVYFVVELSSVRKGSFDIKNHPITIPLSLTDIYCLNLGKDINKTIKYLLDNTRSLRHWGHTTHILFRHIQDRILYKRIRLTKA